MVAPAQANIGIDVADVVTAGGGAIAPVNVKAYGSHFSTGLTSDRLEMCTHVSGFGVGTGIGAGWGIPFVGGRGVGKIPDGIKRKVIETLAKSAQGKAIDKLKSLAWGGVSGGSQIVTGPNARGGMISLSDFQGTFATIIGLGANFVVNGISFGIVIFAPRPVISNTDIIYATGLGLMGGTGLATSLDIEASGMVYRLSVLGTS